MPELPEVETVKEGLIEIIGKENFIRRVELRRGDLRFPFPIAELETVKDAKISRLERLAKYILIHTDKGVLISHLGMTGTWRVDSGAPLGDHDHIVLHLKDSRLVYRDPRRFGIFDFCKTEDLKSFYRFSHLGPDPILSKDFNTEYLYQKSRNKNVPIKNFIMNQEVVVGVGNIYASEALFRSFISPLRLAKSIRKEEAELLVEEILAVLKEAIIAGGSSISDFKQAGGDEGYFQNNFYVYGREGEACPVCANEILRVVQQSRSSFYCKECQK